MSASSDSLTPPIPTAIPIVGVPDDAAAPTSSPPIPTAAPAPTPTATTSTTSRSTTWHFATMPPPSMTPLVMTFTGVRGALRTEITAGNPYGTIIYPGGSVYVVAVTAIFHTWTSDPIPTATGIAKTNGDPDTQAVWAQGSAILLAILVAAGLAISVIRRRLRRLKEHPLARRERHLLKADRRMLQTTTSVVVDTLPRYDTTEQEHATGGAGLRARASALVIRPVSWTWARMSTIWSPQPPASPPPPMPPSPTGPGGTEGTTGAAGGGGARHAWPWTSNSRAGQPPQRSSTGSSVGTNAGGGGAPHGTSEVGSAVSASAAAAAVTDPVLPVPPVTPTAAADAVLSSADALPAPPAAPTPTASDLPATAAAAEEPAPPSNPIAPAPAISPPSASPRTVPTAAPPPAGGASPPRAASPTLRPTAP